MTLKGIGKIAAAAAMALPLMVAVSDAAHAGGLTGGGDKLGVRPYTEGLMGSFGLIAIFVLGAALIFNGARAIVSDTSHVKETTVRIIIGGCLILAGIGGTFFATTGAGGSIAFVAP